MRSLLLLQRNAHGRIAFVVFAVLLFSYAYYLPSPGNANTVSRIALAISLVERGQTDIGDFHEKTKDKSIRDGKYYSDKAPGLSITAVPAVALVDLVSEIGSIPEHYIDEDGWTVKYLAALYLATLLTSGVFTAATGAAIYVVALRLGATNVGALIAALGFGLASPAFGWATNFFGHALAGALLFLGFAVAHHALVRNASGAGGRGVAAGFVVGGLLGWSVVVEFTAAPAAALVGLYALARMAREWPPAAVVRVLSAALAGAVVAAVPLLMYNAASFGSPFTPGYAHVDPRWEGMEEGLFGITYPKLDALYGITLSPFRGLLVFCPLAVLAPLAIYRLARTEAGWGVACLSAAVVLYYLLFNSAYHYWHGGWSTGPRHLIPMLPFLFLPYAQLWSSRPPAALQVLILLLLLASFCISLASVCIDMTAPSEFDNPLFQLILPAFMSGEEMRTVFAVAGWRTGYVLLPYVLALSAGLGYIYWSSRALGVSPSRAPASSTRSTSIRPSRLR